MTKEELSYTELLRHINQLILERILSQKQINYNVYNY